MKEGVWHAAKEVMVDPHGFFRKVHDERNFRKILNFLSVFTLIVFIFSTYQYLDQINSYISWANDLVGTQVLGTIPITLTTYVAAYGILVVLFIALSFLRYWVTHWFVILFGGKHPYQQTYKAMVYTLTPEYLSIPLFAAILILLPFTLMRHWIIGYILLFILGALFLAIAIYQIYLRTIGLAKLQEISNVSALLAIYILGIPTQLLIVGITEIILLAIGFAIYLLITRAF
jgi:hypothetical protein